jgi:hypothetical protein
MACTYQQFADINQRMHDTLACAAIVRITHGRGIVNGSTFDVKTASLMKTADSDNHGRNEHQAGTMGKVIPRSTDKNTARWPTGWRRLGVVVLLAVAVTACTNRIVYDNADWWLNWYIDDYVQFNHEQQRSVDRYLDQQMLWHRQTQLPRYEAFLLQVKQDFAGTPTAPLVRTRFEAIYQFWRDFVSEAMPASAIMLGQLDEKQTRDFLANIEKEARKFDEEYADTTPEKLVQEQLEDTEKSLRKWLGTLTDEQRQIISRWSHTMKNVYPASIEQRKQWQAALELTLREREHRDLFEQRLRTLFVTPADSWSPDYKAMMEANELLTAQMLVDIHRTLTPKQRQHLFATLDGYINDIHKLQKRR